MKYKIKIPEFEIDVEPVVEPVVNTIICEQDFNDNCEFKNESQCLLNGSQNIGTCDKPEHPSCKREFKTDCGFLRNDDCTHRDYYPVCPKLEHPSIFANGDFANHPTYLAFFSRIVKNIETYDTNNLYYDPMHCFMTMHKLTGDAGYIARAIAAYDTFITYLTTDDQGNPITPDHWGYYAGSAWFLYSHGFIDLYSETREIKYLDSFETYLNRGAFSYPTCPPTWETPPASYSITMPDGIRGCAFAAMMWANDTRFFGEKRLTVDWEGNEVYRVDVLAGYVENHLRRILNDLESGGVVKLFMVGLLLRAYIENYFNDLLESERLAKILLVQDIMTRLLNLGMSENGNLYYVVDSNVSDQSTVTDSSDEQYFSADLNMFMALPCAWLFKQHKAQVNYEQAQVWQDRTVLLINAAKDRAYMAEGKQLCQQMYNLRSIYNYMNGGVL